MKWSPQFVSQLPDVRLDEAVDFFAKQEHLGGIGTEFSVTVYGMVFLRVCYGFF